MHDVVVHKEDLHYFKSWSEGRMNHIIIFSVCLETAYSADKAARATCWGQNVTKASWYFIIIIFHICFNQWYISVAALIIYIFIYLYIYSGKIRDGNLRINHYGVKHLMGMSYLFESYSSVISHSEAKSRITELHQMSGIRVLIGITGDLTVNMVLRFHR